MRNLLKDFKGNRPILIQSARAESYLNHVESLEIPVNAKMTDMTDMMEAIFGSKPTLEKFPPYAIVPVKGVIGKSLSPLEAMCGCCDIEDVEEMLEECERDTSIKTVILDIDSPGGTSVGVPELAERVKNYSKDIIAFTASECCSAAYWIGSQARSFYASPSSSVGSIGVYIAFPDVSEAYRMEGVKMEVIKSGIYKGAGIAGTSLDDNQRKMLMDEVVELHNDFKAAVKSVRSFVEDASMEGQIFSGKKGAEAGLVTGIANSFDDLMKSLDAEVYQQIEADEENDNRHAVSSEGGESESRFMKSMSAAERALEGIKLKLSEEEEDEDEEKSEDDEEEKKAKSSDEDDEKDESESNDEGDEDKDKESNDDEDDKESNDDEDKDKESNDEDGVEPQPNDEEDKDKESAEDEDENGDKPVETDSKHDSNKARKNRSRGVA